VLKYDVKLAVNAKGPIISAVLMGIVIFILGRGFGMLDLRYAFESILTFVNIGIGAAVYAVSMLLTGGITRENLLEISPRIYRMIPAGIRRRMR